ncbi:MAG: HNH endonuclease [Bdellovibrionia bacterium]
MQEIDIYKAYRDLGYKSLFEYATQGLRLSESVSYNLITIARKSKEVPQLQKMIRKQEITVSNARMIAPVLTRENQNEWLMAAASLSKRALEKEIAKTLPEMQVQESARYVSEKRIELKLGISEELHEKLKRVQDLVSSQSGKAAKMEVALQAALDLYIEKMDLQKKAERAQAKFAQASVRSQAAAQDKTQPVPSLQPSLQPVPGQVHQRTRYIPAKLKHAVRLRDKGQCALKDVNGKRCAEKRWLEIHHIKSIIDGGANELQNLALVCHAHHQFLHH